MPQGPHRRGGSTAAANRAWWDEYKVKYPFHAESPVSVKPDLVEGDHASVVLHIGWRTWGFRTDSERVTFCMQYGGRPI